MTNDLVLFTEGLTPQETRTRASLLMVRLVERPDAAEQLATLAGDTNSLATVVGAIDRLVGLLKILRRDAEAMLVEAMDKKKTGTPVDRQELEVAGLLVERVQHGGVWQQIDYRAALRDVVRAYLAENGGEVGLSLAEAFEECFSFGGLKSNAKEGTGLAKWGLKREDYGVQTERTFGAKVQGF